MNAATTAVCEIFDGYLSIARIHLLDQILHDWRRGAI